MFNRRNMLKTTLSGAASALTLQDLFADLPFRFPSHSKNGSNSLHGNSHGFQLNFMLASSMYGQLPLAEILPQVAKTGAMAIDIWPKVHGNQREQIDAMGVAKFVELLQKHKVKLGCLTQYPLGPLGLEAEMKFAERLKCETIVTGGRGQAGLRGDELKKAVIRFVEQMKPHLAIAEETGVTIAIENHSNNLIHSPDSLKWLVEYRTSDKLAIALAPYHLEQDAGKIANLIRALGDGIRIFYAWQHGKGCMKKLPKQDELLQMPGRGALDFTPILTALADMRFSGWTEIFMHPVPRGIPILDTSKQVTDEINRSRKYLSKIVKTINESTDHHR